MPRISLRQQLRSNPPSTSLEEYFKLSVTIPTTSFAAHVEQSAAMQKLLPAYDSSVGELEEAVAFYKDDLPVIPEYKRPKTLSECMKQCCPESLPNVFTLLKLLLSVRAQANALRQL